MNYSLKRKLSVYGIILLLILIAFYWFYDAQIKEKPTCFDNKKNGLEEGIDCGGECAEICTFKAEKINVNWTRSFEVIDGVYNVAASIDNPNFNYSFEVEYLVRYMNERNINVGEHRAVTKLKPLEKKIIFIAGIQLPNQKIATVYLEPKRIFNLKKTTEVDDKLRVNSKEIVREKDLTKLKLIIENEDYIPKRDLLISAVLFDRDGNVIDVNRTFLEYIDKNSREEVFMTWPKELADEIAEIKIIINKADD